MALAQAQRSPFPPLHQSPSSPRPPPSRPRVHSRTPLSPPSRRNAVVVADFIARLVHPIFYRTSFLLSCSLFCASTVSVRLSLTLHRASKRTVPEDLRLRGLLLFWILYIGRNSTWVFFEYKVCSMILVGWKDLHQPLRCVPFAARALLVRSGQLTFS